MKKVLSIVLSIAMVVCLAPTMAFAATTNAAQSNAAYSDIEGKACEGAVNVLSALKVVDGFTDGTYKPEQTVTRAQMAKLIVTALGVADYATAKTSKYTDMGAATWAIPYVEYASNLNIVNGVGNSKFNPNGLVTYEQAATMIVRALGYTDQCKEMNGTWPAIYIQKAMALNIFDDVVNGGANGANRGDVAIMLYNALDIAQVYADGDGATCAKSGNNKTTYNGKTIQGVTMMGTLNKNGSAAYGIVTDSDVDGAAANIRAYLGTAAKITKDKNGDVIAIGDVKTQLLTGNFDGDDTFTVGDTDYICNPKYKTINEDGTVENAKAVISLENGKVVTKKVTVKEDNKDVEKTVNATRTLEYAKNSKGEFVEDDKTDFTIAATVEGKTITGIYSIATWNATTAAKVSDSNITQINKNKKLLGYSFEKNNDGEIDTASFTLLGVNSLNEIKKDNVVAVYTDGTTSNKITRVEVGTTVVKGEITKKYTDKITIDGKNYKISKLANHKKEINNDIFKAGNEVELTLDYKGKIYDAELVNGMSGNYAVVIDKTSAEGRDKIATGLDADTLKIKMIFADGTVKTVEADSSKLNNNNVTPTEWNAIVSKDLVTYQINSSGQLTDIEKVSYSEPKTDSSRVSSTGVYDTYTISDTAAIFRLPDANDDVTKASNYSVVKKSALLNTSKVSASYKLNKDNTVIEAMTITKSSDDTKLYGIINSSYKNSDDDQVVTGFIGKDALESGVVDQIKYLEANTGKKLDDRIFEITKSGNGKYDFNEIAEVGSKSNDDSTSVTVKDGALYYGENRINALGSAPVVYVWNDKSEEYEVGDISDIDAAAKDAKITYYQTVTDKDKDNYNLITYVVIK